MDRSWAEPGVRIIAVLATHERKHDRNTAEGLSSLSTAVAHPTDPGQHVGRPRRAAALVRCRLWHAGSCSVPRKGVATGLGQRA